MTRKKFDAYYTPSFLVESLLEKPYLHLSGLILEPCTGEGAIANALKKHCLEAIIETNDINPELEVDFHRDCRELLKEDRYYNWIVTNPPFNIAHEIIPLAYEKALDGIVMLLRLSYLEPCQNRKDWLMTYPPDVVVINKRVSFTGNGKSDSCTTAWLVWRKKASEKIIDFIF